MKEYKIAMGAEHEIGVYGTQHGRRLSGSFDQVTKMIIAAAYNDTDPETFITRVERASHRQPQGLSSMLKAGVTEDGIWTPSGMRLYEDHFHPEICTPESDDPEVATACLLAGYRFMNRLRIRAEQLAGPEFCFGLYANTTDYRGHSFGCHENYSLDRETFGRIVESRELMQLALLFFVSRTIVVGSGSVNLDRAAVFPYELSERARYFSRDYSSDTTQKRGIINTRDESWTDSENARLHVIVGDANMSPFVIRLKYAMTALFLMMLCDGILERDGGAILTPLNDAVAALHLVSRDTSLRRPVRLVDGTTITALELQHEFQSHAALFVCKHNLPPVWKRAADDWRAVLDGFEGDRWGDNAYLSELDWIRKLYFIEAARAKRPDLAPNHELFRKIALEYHNLDQEKGLYWKKPGSMWTAREQMMCHQAETHAPAAMRGWFREQTIRRFQNRMIGMAWDRIVFPEWIIIMDDPWVGNEQYAHTIFEGDPGYEEYIARIRSLIDAGGLPGCKIYPYSGDESDNTSGDHAVPLYYIEL